MRFRRSGSSPLAIVVVAVVLANVLLAGAPGSPGGARAGVALAATPGPNGSHEASSPVPTSPAPSLPGPSAVPGGPPSDIPSMDVFSDDVTIDLLARSGVAVYPDEQATQPVVPLAVPEISRVTSWQLRNMAAEARVGGGILGSDLDRAVPLKGTRLPFSYLLAAWLSSSDSAGATALRDHMGTQAWTDAPGLVYPTLALELFSVDVATAGGQVTVPVGRPSGRRERVTALAAIAGGGVVPALGAGAGTAQVGTIDTDCSTVTAFINGTLNGIFDGLRIDPSSLGDAVPGKVFHFLADLWNTAVGLARQVVDAAISQLTAPVVQAIRVGVGVVALISQVTSYLKPWVITVEAAPTTVQVPFAAPGATGSFRARADVSVQSEQWPPILLDCADALHKTLPQLAAAGAPTSWDVLGSAPGLVAITTPGYPALKLGQDRTSTITYETTVDPPENAKGPPLFDTVWATVTVQRKEVGELQDMIRTFAYGQVPGPVLTVVQATIGPHLDRLLNHAASLLSPLLDARGRSVDVDVAHHGPPVKPTPSGACSGVQMAAGSYAGSNTSDETIVSSPSVIRAHTTGPVSIQVAADGGVTGTWGYTSDFVEDVNTSPGLHHESTTVMSGGTVSGTACDLVLALGSSRVTHCFDSLTGDCTATSKTPTRPRLGQHLGPPSIGADGAYVWQGHQDDGTTSVSYILSLTAH